VESLVQDVREQALDHLALGVWVARAPSGEGVYSNAAFREIMGVGTVSGIGIEETPSAYGIFDRAGAPYPVERLPFSRALAAGGPVMVDDLVVHRRDGRRVNVRAFATPMRNPAGEIAFITIVFLDITAEVAAVSEGRAVQNRLNFAINHAPVILFTVNSQGVVTLSEGAGLVGLGFAPGQLVGRNVFDIYKETADRGDMQRALAGEALMNTAEIGETVLETHLNPVRDEAGRILEVIGISIDVTTQRRFQANVIQNDRLMAMGTLAASVAHEINNPLTYILGNIQRMEEELSRIERIERSVGGEAVSSLSRMLMEVRAGAKRVQQVAQDLRSFVRPEDETITALDLRVTIGVVLQLVRKEAEAHAELELRLAPQLPPVRANESRLVQVILNLLVNAWQALPDPDPRRHKITLAAYQERESDSEGDVASGKVVVEVCDTGRGVPAELRQRIFEPFFTTKEIGGGTGLGLFVCRNIVSSLGGDISVDDAPGGGARFRVRLPVAEPAALSAPAPAPPARRSPAKGGRVLIIDDDEMVAATLVNSLRREYEVTALHDAKEALDLLLSEARVDLVYCDLMMKGLTGMDIYERLKAEAPHRLAALVFMTGGAFTGRAATFVDERADAVVYKPFSVLEETQRRLAGRRS
jgi:PAS domain S-box-containing protein